MLVGVLKVEVAGFKLLKVDCLVLSKVGWVGVGVGVVVRVAVVEFLKVKELLKLGVRVGLVVFCCCLLVVLNVGWVLVFGYVGRGLVFELKGMLNVGVVVLLNVSVGWLVVIGVEVVRVLLKLLKSVVLLLAVV